MTEQVAYAAGTDADKHFDEVGTGHGEEGHVGFAGYGFGQKSLSGARRAYQESAFGDFSAQFGIFLRVFQKIDDFLHFLFGSFLSGYILERNIDAVALFKKFGLALADIEDAARGSAATAHAAHHQKIDAEDEDEGKQGAQEIPPDGV